MRGRLFIALVVCMALGASTAHAGSAHESSRVGSKTFTESVILGELVRLLLVHEGDNATHQRQLGGTRILFAALTRGDIDVYADYTGTVIEEILASDGVSSVAEARTVLAAQGIEMSQPLGFNNTYVLGMTPARARELHITRISDLRRHPDIRFGFSNEFMDRGDGWPALRSRYGLPQKKVSGLVHDLAYRGLVSGTIDVIDMYSTDAEIAYYDLEPLDDDLRHFPQYDAILLFRTAHASPAFRRAVGRLESSLTERSMAALNARVKIERIPETNVAATFLAERMNLHVETEAPGLLDDFLRYLLEHLYLVAVSLSAAIFVSLPLGILAARRPRFGQIVLAVVGVLQTIPSLALLVFLIPLLGIGGPPAIVALFLYSLLPIVRNTYTGIHDISPPMRESAEALGLPKGAQLRLVELPMASRTILAGIKTSAVINVGTATLGALIGAGGFGQPILTGIRLDDNALILQGAIPAALLAIVVQALFDGVDRLVVPKGLRLKGP